MYVIIYCFCNCMLCTVTRRNILYHRKDSRRNRETPICAKAGVLFVKKKQGHSPVELIIHKRRWIEKIFSVLFVFSLLCIPLVGVNYDLTKYLPDDAPSAQALDIMEEEFTYPGIGRVLLQDVTLREAKDIKDRIADVDGVDMILWCDSTTNIYGSSEFIDYDDIEDYYKDGDAYMDITFLESDSSDRTHAAVKEIQKIIDGKGVMAGSAASDTELGPTINTEVAHVMILAVVVIFLILTLTTTSCSNPCCFSWLWALRLSSAWAPTCFLVKFRSCRTQSAQCCSLPAQWTTPFSCCTPLPAKKRAAWNPNRPWRTLCAPRFPPSAPRVLPPSSAFSRSRSCASGSARTWASCWPRAFFAALARCFCSCLRSFCAIRAASNAPHTARSCQAFIRWANLPYHIRVPLTVIVLLLVVPCYVGQGMANFSYGNEALTNSPGMDIYENEQLMNEKFGRSNMMLALVPVGDNVTEKAMTDELDGLPYVRMSLGLASALPSGIPEDFLPESITGQLHSKNWSRIIINVRLRRRERNRISVYRRNPQHCAEILPQ